MYLLSLCASVVALFSSRFASNIILDAKIRLSSEQLDIKQKKGLEKKIQDATERVNDVRMALIKTQNELKDIVNSNGATERIEMLNAYEKELNDRLNQLNIELDHYKKSVEKIKSKIRINPNK